jgi:hypothetical protein
MKPWGAEASFFARNPSGGRGLDWGRRYLRPHGAGNCAGGVCRAPATMAAEVAP